MAESARKWQVEILQKFRKGNLKIRKLKAIILKILEDLESSDLPAALPDELAEISVVFTTDLEIQELNQRYRGKDQPTDVLSFPQLEGNVGPAPFSLGDVVISVETAKRQAEELGITLQQEIFRLLIHGILHLLGFRHEDVSEEEVELMQSVEERLFQRYLGEYVDFQ